MKELGGSQVDLWFANLEDFDLCLVGRECADWLNSEEANRMRRYQSRRQQEHFVLGRIILRLTLSKYFGCSPSDFNFHTDNQGKLFLNSNNPPSLFFSLSHSYNRLVVAVSRVRDMGIDVELVNEKREILKIAKRYFSPREFQDLSNLKVSVQTKRFYELWTLKESVLKALGVGLSGFLSKVKFTFPTSDKLDLQFVFTEQGPAKWQSWQIKTLEPYVLALSVKSLDTKINHIESHTFMSLDKIVPGETEIIRSF